MRKSPGSLATPAGRAMQIGLDDAERAALPGRQDRGVPPLAVDLRGVHKSFGSVQAVRGVALAVGSGEVMAFLGPNGAGKTSTIDMILGLSRPDAGAVEVYGMAPRQAVRKGRLVLLTGGLAWRRHYRRVIRLHGERAARRHLCRRAHGAGLPRPCPAGPGPARAGGPGADERTCSRGAGVLQVILAPGASPALATTVDTAVAFIPRSELVGYVRRTEGLALCGRGAACPG